MSVVPFKRPEEPTGTWSEGRALCIGCRHEWEAAAPTGTWQLECPECGSMKGIFKYPIGAQVGDLMFRCVCGCEAMTAYSRAGRYWHRCMSCGIDQTDALFNA